jgi:hypothetical protein
MPIRSFSSEDDVMQKLVLVMTSAMVAGAGIILMEAGERAIAAGAVAVLSAISLMLYRRFRRVAHGVSWIIHASAAIAVTLGTITLLSGVVHEVAVTAVALTEGVWIPLTILRLTTGAMLVFAGAMSIAMHRPMRDGRRWSIGVGLATSVLFWFYLMLLFPLPGTRGTVPPMLGLWSAYLVWLGAAVVTSLPRRLPAMPPQRIA